MVIIECGRTKHGEHRMRSGEERWWGSLSFRDPRSVCMEPSLAVGHGISESGIPRCGEHVHSVQEEKAILPYF